jgi:sporulation protein YlmC with PRC-barrel domain
MRLELGTRVHCEDGADRELADIVIDAARNSVTHLVVQPHDDPDGARLVPMGLVNRAGEGQELSLRLTAEALDRLDRVHEHAYLRAGQHAQQEPGWDIGVEDLQAVPNPTPPGAFPEYVGDPAQDVTMTYDRVPKGEIELRHASDVYSSESHHLGHVDAVVLDDGDAITHLLLERGHLWWKREITIPVSAISKLETDMVTLGATKQEVGGFPSQKRG